MKEFTSIPLAREFLLKNSVSCEIHVRLNLKQIYKKYFIFARFTFDFFLNNDWLCLVTLSQYWIFIQFIYFNSPWAVARHSIWQQIGLKNLFCHNFLPKNVFYCCFYLKPNKFTFFIESLIFFLNIAIFLCHFLFEYIHVHVC
jgi:hypothetical protein